MTIEISNARQKSIHVAKTMTVIDVLPSTKLSNIINDPLARRRSRRKVRKWVKGSKM